MVKTKILVEKGGFVKKRENFSILFNWKCFDKMNEKRFFYEKNMF